MQCLDWAVQAWPRPTLHPATIQHPEHSHCALQTTDLLGSQQIWTSEDDIMKSFCLDDAMALASPKRNSVTYLLFNDEMKINHISQQITAVV